ncbi:ABC transporter substrate-binding protein [Alloyangia pacifica]|uniref:Multiple sugar transport system substrate-binding protein n=1 Tax=Alloyangia pacifica TaxID=311180 RepID=A0A1I6QRW4_9RHOB|nr:extracellular solute-binding protein [Alloyangia pacifica]SDF96793.1 multiple sugar transport system substrate-binding protein [Alloyangia pacifica]SFS55183.1 multiple sugar transport system substrate-binding protein [Alloyangia pacifica]
MTKTLLRTGAALVALTAAMPAMAEEITMIVCGDNMNPVQQKYIDQWEAENEGWTVAPEVVGWGQCQDKVTTLAVAGTPVGLAYVGSRTLKEFAEFGLIEPIPMSDEEKASYFPNVVDTVTYQGEQWGVPVAFSTKAFYWNKDLFKEAGLDPETPPKTWAEVIDAAKAVTENTDSAGFGLVAKTFDNTMHQFLHWVYTNNGQVVDDEGNIVLNSPQNLEALEAYKTLVPYSEEGPTAYEQNEVRAIFLDGGVSMMHASISAVSRLQDTDIDWGVANLPLGPEAEGPGTLLITDSLAVFSGSGYEEKAIELAKFLTAPEAQEEYDLAEGLTPLRPSANIDALVAENPYWAPYIDGIEFGGPEPLFTDYRGFQNIMIEMVQSVVTGQAEPADALAKADAALKELE